jgi:UDP-N-acetylmuramoyl-tripeptide--D-alanyl-D-alanine ligase
MWMQGDALFEGVSTDSRSLETGNIFVALRGERIDAHRFLPDVAQKGAAAAVAEQIPAGFSLPCLCVPDSRIALGEMARFWRQAFSMPVIAVTGSNGKTTVKEMIACILHDALGENYLATEGNLNNDIGVPQTLFRLKKNHRLAVLELGMNHVGEIAYLVQMSQPTVGLVNNAQREHQEFMGSVQAVAEENGQVIRMLPTDGIAVFPAEDAFSGLWQQYAQEEGKRKVITFGTSHDATVRGNYTQQNGKTELTVRIEDITFSVSLSVIGAHHVHNALAAIACCYGVGIAPEVIARGLARFLPVAGRMQYKTAANGAVLIDDTYNANPDSVLAAIDVLADMASPRYLILGDMGEVGVEGARFHEEVGTYARNKGIEHFYALGELSRHAARAYGPPARHYDRMQALTDTLHEEIPPVATVLVKGSRFMKMEQVIARLQTGGSTSTQ